MGSQRVRHDWATELNWTEDVFKIGRKENVQFEPKREQGKSEFA